VRQILSHEIAEDRRIFILNMPGFLASDPQKMRWMTEFPNESHAAAWYAFRDCG
jgi:hypothetical protein